MRSIRKACARQGTFFWAIPGLIWQVLFCIVPLCTIFLTSFFIHSWFPTLANYEHLFVRSHLIIIFWSLFLALLTACICLLFGYPLALWLALYARRFKNIGLFFLVVPFWTNLLVLIYSWIFILERGGIINRSLLYFGIIQEPLSLLNTLFAVALVMVYCYLPFMVLPIFNSLEKIDKTLLEASADLGATMSQSFKKIIVPLSWPGIRTGFFLVFVPVFGEFSIPLLMGGDKYMFVGNAISHYVFVTFNLSQGAAFTVFASLILLISSVVIVRYGKRLFYQSSK